MPPDDSNDNFQSRFRRADSWTAEFIQEAITNTPRHSITDDTTPTISPQEAITRARAALEKNTYTIPDPHDQPLRDVVRGIVSNEPQVQLSISSALKEIQAQQHQEVSHLKEAAIIAIDAYESLIATTPHHDTSDETTPTNPSSAIAYNALRAAKKSMKEAVGVLKNAQTPSRYVELLNEVAKDLICYPAIEFFQKRATREQIANLSRADRIPLAIGTHANPRLVLDDSKPSSLREGALQTAIELRTAHMLATVAAHVTKDHLTSDSASTIIATTAHERLAEINRILDSRTIHETIFKRAHVSLSLVKNDQARVTQLVSPRFKTTKTATTLAAPSKEPSRVRFSDEAP